MATKFTIQIVSRDPDTLEEVSTNIGYVNPALLEESDKGAAKVDTCARALIGLSNNTYVDTYLVTTESVTEILVG